MATSTSASIPFIYRLVLTTLEPLIAIGGAIQTLAAPTDYISILTRDSVPFDPATRFLYTELAGAWFYFAFVEAVVLRLFDDVRLWKVLCVGMLLSDVCYAHSAAQAVGGWAAWARLEEWTVMDWVVLVTTAPQLVVRVLVILGVGVRERNVTGVKRS